MVGARPVPYAAILRISLLDGDARIGQALAVAKLAAGGSCVIGFVDVGANPNANAMARQAADRQASSFDCARDKKLPIGAMSPALAERLR